MRILWFSKLGILVNFLSQFLKESLSMKIILVQEIKKFDGLTKVDKNGPTTKTKIADSNNTAKQQIRLSSQQLTNCKQKDRLKKQLNQFAQLEPNKKCAAVVDLNH